jgi:hypothetical protein
MSVFPSSFEYTDRQSKAEYVWRRYGSLLHDVLDVGADQGYLRPFIQDAGGRYAGVGFGTGVDLELDLERGSLPYTDRSYETVLCLDTLEHIERVHDLFDELCRVARRYVLVSLPNCWAAAWHSLRIGDYRPGEPMKFYGLPERPPEDRHRWFFSLEEARRFLVRNGERNGFEVAHSDTHAGVELFGPGVRGHVKRILFRRLFRRDIENLELTNGTLWCLLRRVEEGE